MQGIRPSRLYYEYQVLQSVHKHKSFHPNFTDIIHERGLQDKWNNDKPDTPFLLQFFLPRDVHFIGHQLTLPGNSTSVKWESPGQSLLARAYYQYGSNSFGTNVAFSTRVLESNMNSEGGKHWLVGSDAKAAILFLHGGGSKSAGAHVAETIISHFSHYKIDVLAPDLPWHAEGHREFLGNFEHEIRALSSFAKNTFPLMFLYLSGDTAGGLFLPNIL